MTPVPRLAERSPSPSIPVVFLVNFVQIAACPSYLGISLGFNLLALAAATAAPARLGMCGSANRNCTRSRSSDNSRLGKSACFTPGYSVCGRR